MPPPRRMDVSLADFNRLKYNAMMKGRRSAPPAPSKQAAPKGMIEEFKQLYYNNSFRVADFIDRLNKGKTFTYINYTFEDVKMLVNNSDLSVSKPLVLIPKEGELLVSIPLWLVDGSSPKEQIPIQELARVLKVAKLKLLATDPFTIAFQRKAEVFLQIMEEINKKTVVLVAPEYVRNELSILKTKYSVVIPSGAAVNDIVESLTIIEATAKEAGDNKLVFVFIDVSGTIKVADVLHTQFAGRHWLIDAGTVFQNFLAPQRRTRPYMQEHRARFEKMYGQLLTGSVNKSASASASASAKAAPTTENKRSVRFAASSEESSTGASTSSESPSESPNNEVSQALPEKVI